MKLIKLLSVLGATLVCTLAVSGPAQAAAFSITGAIFHPGSGYGVDINEGSDTLLDVVFSSSVFAQQNFVLLPSGSTSFKVGTINFAEPNGIEGIHSSETDNLGVSIDLTFAAPGVGVQNVTATGVAIPGSVQDGATDYTITWTPVDITFGNSGVYQISLDTVAFTTNGTKDQNVTITLLAEDVPATDVPEPGSMALLGLGLLGLARLRRKTARPE